METRITVLSSDETRELITDCLRDEIRFAVREAVREATRKEYLTKRELMTLTGWSSRQVEYRKANRTIPFVRRGRTVLFPTAGIIEFLEAGRVEPER